MSCAPLARPQKTVAAEKHLRPKLVSRGDGVATEAGELCKPQATLVLAENDCDQVADLANPSALEGSGHRTKPSWRAPGV